ncbi:MAG TPA: helix-turn-helix domain-containing protein, partial [Candidatus Methylomirabilis sp.]|nr:helix-turn-helix domain-containing protein [Candidatus Methylomirabilis sp.]
PFPGNVRELDNTARRFCSLWKPEQETAAALRLLDECLSVGREEKTAQPADLKAVVRQTEKAILQDLVDVYGSRQQLARLLGVNRSTLWRKLKKHRVETSRE